MPYVEGHDLVVENESASILPDEDKFLSLQRRAMLLPETSFKEEDEEEDDDEEDDEEDEKGEEEEEAGAREGVEAVAGERVGSSERARGLLRREVGVDHY